MLFNNAGIVTGRKFLDTPDEMNIKTMEVRVGVGVGVGVGTAQHVY
jgi:hypothetical protein